METLKNEIKKMAETQKLLRDQRKTVYNKLARTIDPYNACIMHSENRQVLREMYAAYGILRGKTIEEVKSNYGKINNEFCVNNFKYAKSNIDKLVEKHKLEFVKNEETVCVNQ